MISLFRNLVVLSYIVYVVFLFIPHIAIYIYNHEILDALSWTGYGSYLEINNVFGYLFFIAYTITMIGLLYFKSWARGVFVVLILLSVLLTGTQGVEVLPAAEGVLSYITNLIDGATIAIMYLTSLNTKFKNNA